MGAGSMAGSAAGWDMPERTRGQATPGWPGLSIGRSDAGTPVASRGGQTRSRWRRFPGPSGAGTSAVATLRAASGRPEQRDSGLAHERATAVADGDLGTGLIATKDADEFGEVAGGPLVDGLDDVAEAEVDA